MIDTILTLIAIEDIRRVKARYFRHADHQELDAYRKLFADDARIDISGALAATTDNASAMSELADTGVFHSADAFLDHIRRFTPPGLRSAHHGHMSEIDIISPTLARGIFAMEDNVWFPPGSAYAHMHGFGWYHDEFVKQDDAWLISSLRLERVHVEYNPGV